MNTRVKGDDIAVIGMAGRFPGAGSVAEFWDNLCANRDSVRTLTDDELRAAGVPEAQLADADYVKVAAPLDGVAQFDPGFFKISPLEAELMDPQIRLLLQCAWETLEDAGHARHEAQRIGVFAGAGGVTTSYFAHFVNRHERFEKITAGAAHLGNDKDFLATYLSYKLNLTGPSVTVQTACSTSLVALHQARLSLLNGECDMALAGGVTVRVPHLHGYRYQDGYIFSRSGRTRTFDADADGVVFGSGLGLVLIRRLADALRDGDPIHAVIKGSAIANDGKGKMSYAASSAKGQIACARAALDNAGVSADSIGLIEAHGTGTAMGDPEEVKALSAVFKEQTGRKGYCALGAVKTQIGHLEAAAGIAGLIKAVLAVKHGLIPPVAHYTRPNPRIRFENTPFYVNRELAPWQAGPGPRRAAVNSLGVGGTNAFVVIEEYVPAKGKPAAAPAAPVVVPLSARTDESLRAYAARLAAFLAARGDDAPGLAALAYTLQTGRAAMARRVAFAVASLAGLQAALAHYLAHGEAPPADDGEAARLAAAWAAGEAIDWAARQGRAAPRRVHLPTYVFAAEHCWMASHPAAPVQALLHPLLHANTSDLDEHRYSATFTGDEPFLRDHRLRRGTGDDAQRILPGVAYLEMARAAVREAGVPDAALELRDVVWLQPIAVAQPVQVRIALLPREPGRIDFEVYTGDDAIHCQGRCLTGEATPQAPHDLAALRAALRHEGLTADAVYRLFGRMGLQYGPAHRAIVSVERGGHQLLAQLHLPPAVRADASGYVLHPSLMDGALQAATLLLVDPARPPERPMVPFAVASVRLLQPCPARPLVWARRAPAVAGERAVRLDLDLLDDSGAVCVAIRGFVARPLGGEDSGSLLATQQWRPDPGTAPVEGWARRVVLCGLPQLDAARIAPDCRHLPLAARGGPARRYGELALAGFEALQALMAARPSQGTLLQFVLPDSDEHALYAGLAGMMKTAQLEQPRVAGQIVLVEPGIGAEALAGRLEADATRPHDTLVRYPHGVRHTAHWQVLDDAGADTLPCPFREQGVYLITGGLGGLGRLFAQEILARSPHARIVLTGRAAPAQLSAGQAAGLAALAAAGGVEYRQLDLGNARRVAALVAAIGRQHGRLDGILHCAGTIDDDFMLKKDAARFAEVLAPKVQGTVHLDQATRGLDLDFLVLFSSLTSALGNLGQADYAAANGFLDGFAHYRNRLVAAGERRGATLAIRWPLWRDGGMQPDEAGRRMLRESTGIAPLDSATGMQLFYRSLAGGHDQTLAMAGELPRMLRALRGVTAPPQPAAAVAVSAGADLAAAAEALLCRQLAALCKLPEAQIDARAPLEDYGIDSILGLELIKRLEAGFGALPKTLFFEYLTVHELAGYFAREHAVALAALSTGSAAPATAPAVVVPATVASLRVAAPRPAPVGTEPIAIVGLSGRYPEAHDLAAFWDNLRAGRDCIVEVPASRWDWRDYYSADRGTPGAHYSKWGGFIDGVDEFDARFFNVSPLEAQLLDPQERLFLQHAWLAIEDAGYTRERLQIPQRDDLPAQVGVYAGVMYGEYQLFGAEASLRGERSGFASNPASIANRVSYFLNLHGPSMVVDTMCSSSLTAIHLACQDLRLGRTALALAGGVNVTIHPNKYLMLSAGQFISGDGHCQSFGEGGDGYIPGEGVGVVVLKRLSDAERDGDPIHGVIRGSALSHGGKTNGYTVPNPQAQASAIRQALAEAGVEARAVSYIEAHGTGTRLGDPIEIAALAKVFREHTPDSGFCLIGSAKSNIGHCEAAAGIAGLTKVLLQLKHRQIVPSLHSARLNPHIDFASTPFTVNQTLRPWDAPVRDGRTLPRIAGISSFGAGGSNAHLIVEEYRAAGTAPQAMPLPAIVPLSARTAEQLQHKARDLARFVRAEAPPLAALAYTLQLGREAMGERLVVLADSTDMLADRLDAYLADQAVDGLHRGQAKAGAHTAPRAALHPASLTPPQLAARWAGGEAVDWRALHAAPHWVTGLPGYPFARQRFWADAASRPATPLPGTALHPLLHRNTSDLAQHSYGATFRGDEFFFDGAPGQTRLSTAACLEMARAAFAAALPGGAPQAVELSQVAFARPLRARGGEPLTLALFGHDGTTAKFELYGVDEDGSGIVHCQGIVRAGGTATPEQVDPAAIAPHQRVALPLPGTLAHGHQDYVLHPALLGAALAAAGAAEPLAVATLHALRPAAQARLAWVRPGAQGIDIDLCDAAGLVCVALRGVRLPDTLPSAVPATAASAVVAPRPVALPLAAPMPSDPVRAKPSIALTPPAAAAAFAAGTAPKPRIALTAPGDGMSAADGTVTLSDHGDGVFALRIAAPGDNALSEALLAKLLAALHTVQAQPTAKVLLLEGGPTCFLTGALAAHRAALAMGCYDALATSAVPVIAVVRGAVDGAGLLVAAACDFLVCGEHARLASAMPQDGLPSEVAEPVLVERFGRAVADDLLYLAPGASGAGLAQRGWRGPVLPDDEVEAYALALARALAAKPRLALQLLKQQLNRRIVAALQAPPAPTIAGIPIPQDTAVTTLPTAPSARLTLAAHGAHALVVTIQPQADDAGLLLADLATLFEHIARLPYRCVVLASMHPQFLPGAPDAALALRLRDTLLGLARPVIAALGGAPSGLAWYAAQLCQACVYAEEGHYAVGDALSAPALADAAWAAFSLRLGEEAALQLLLAGDEVSGAQLHAGYGARHVVPAAMLLTQALALADALAAWPLPQLAGWQQRAAALLAAPAAPMLDAPEADAPPVGPVALSSTVIEAIAHPHGVLEVRMADRAARNMFSEAFSQGLGEAFAHVAAHPGYKVVVLTGYDSYFASGGTEATLRAIQQGQARFTDNPVFRLPLDCPLPVIAAMQGHGIGAGWALGMYADLVLFSDESRYVSPYMEYGFTPGAGTTWLFPHALGHDLARETLLTAREYAGGVLKARGLAQTVLPRAAVLPAALALAGRIAQQPRARLLRFKAQRGAALHPALAQALEHELAMHERTFVGEAGTLAGIERRFGAPAQPAALPAVVSSQPAAAADLPALTAALRRMLAHELRMPEHEIGEDEQFVELGLDSITGVTWIRSINEVYGTALEAIEVYSHPTLGRLACHLQALLPQAAALPPLSASAAGDPAALLAELRRMLAHELRMPEHEIGEDEQFVELGLDSITGVTWIRSINEVYGTALEAIEVYSHPTLRRLASHVGGQLRPAAVPQPVPPAAAAAAAIPALHTLLSWRGQGRVLPQEGALRVQPIAVIGMAGRFPKAPDLATFWRNIAEGRDCIDEIPPQRWDIERYYQAGEAVPGKTYSRWMGVLDGHDRFDAAFFNISPREARSMDPQQRLFLEVCWHGIEHAGYNPRALAGSRCGVFVGCSAGDYHQLSRREQLSGQGFTGAAPSILAARIAYFLDLHGPSLSIDTACSSSLVAVATACDSLIAHGCDVALAGGVNVMAGPAMQIMTAQLGMLSPQGRCFTFDARASGIVNGEGVGVVLLKRLADAERDGDAIHGVLEGWGVNQDGRTNGITAPNADAQARLQETVYRRFGIDPAGIGLIEAHGTGTALGDPIEVAGLKAAFGRFTRNQDYCALGSVKSNIGHCLSAAGISGLLKALLALGHAQLPPAAHFRQLNPHIALAGSPFYVNARLQPWPQGQGPRRAAVNSFGFSGTNAHVVVAEHRRPAAAPSQSGPMLVPLSARTDQALRHQARDLLAFLQAMPDAPLDDIAYTLQLGREEMDERAAFIADTPAALVAQLQAFAAGEAAPGIYQGALTRGRETLAALAADPDFQRMLGNWIARRALARLADLWVQGLALDWAAFHAGGPLPRRIGLPGYPFADERHWLDAEPESAAVPAAGTRHPLLQTNTADLYRQQYRTALAGDECFLTGRELPDAGAQRVLSAAACLEMACAALAEALPQRAPDAPIALHGLVWQGALAAPQAVSIALAPDGDGAAFEIFGASDAPAHCQGLALPHHAAAPATLDLASLRARLRTAVPAISGTEAIAALHLAAGEALAHLTLPAALVPTLTQYRLHPVLLDAALHAGLTLLGETAPGTLDAAEVLAACPAEAFAWARRSAGSAPAVDIDVCDGDGRICVTLRGLAPQHTLHAGLMPQVEPALPTAPAVAAPAPLAAVAAQPDARPALSVLRQDLRASLAQALYMKPAEVDEARPFTELGLDSIVGVEWVKVINRRWGSNLSATRVYDYPNVAVLAAFLHAQLPGAAPAAPAAPAAVPVPAPLVAAQPDARPSLPALRQDLRASLAQALYMKPAEVDEARPFTELGLDSIVGVEWVKVINRRWGSNLSATRVYDYPNVAALAAFLHAQLPGAAPAVAPLVPDIAPAAPAAVVAVPVVAHAAVPPLRSVRRPAAGGLHFEPKFGKRFKDLYFHCADGEGDFETDGEFSVRCVINPETNVCLREHVVFGRHLLPTDAYVELVYAACRTYFSEVPLRLEQIALVSPLLGVPGCDTGLKVTFRRAGEALQFTVHSAPAGAADDETLHLQGRIVPAHGVPAGRLGADFTVERELDGAQIRTNAGTWYAPLQQLQLGRSAALGRIRVAGHDWSFLANPFALYGGLCTVINHCAYLAEQQFGPSDDEFLPHRIGAIAFAGPLDQAGYDCHARLRALAHDAASFDFELVDASGRAVLTVEDIGLRRVARSTLERQAVMQPPRPSVMPRGTAEVAVIGMACRYPMSETVEAFWDNLKAGRDCVTEVPAGRWDGHADWYHPDPRHPHTSYSRWGGFLEGIDAFDALFFGIAPAEAELIDPQQRLFLEECWKAIERAGYAPGALSDAACGVYVGCAGGDYARVLAGDGQDTAGAAFMGTSSAILAARISYHLNLKGPALAIDTACSSSLVAVHLACESIRRGENRLALAGGVNLLTTPIGHILTSQVGMPSRDGRCAAFDASADGIVFSEGCGVLLLKALADAERDGDDILGVIRGSGINQDGKTNGITAPSALAQEALLRQVYGRFGIDAARIGYVEAHGTATPLGDPIEVSALTAAFGSGGQARCALGSVKSNIGHTGFAAGVAGMIKALLCLRHRMLVPSIHYARPNPHIAFGQSPFHVNTQYRAWDSATPRLAAVSSFGFSGTNAHVVIEEYTAPPAAPQTVGEVLVPLSAKTAEQLRHKARDLLAALRREPVPDLARLAYTLQVGRDPMPHRLALICDGIEPLAQQLAGWLDGDSVDGVLQGQAARGDDLLAAFADDEQMRGVIAHWVAGRNLHKVAQLWVRGFELDWHAFHPQPRPRRMALPAYPFARERCWVAATQAARRGAPAAAAAVLHPLLHRNTSDLSQQRYDSTFSGDEFFLADHRVDGRRMLPAVAYLEMARAALLDALPPERATHGIELRHVVWAQPIVVDAPRRVAIAVFAEQGDALGFEVYSQDGADEALHCQGSGVSAMPGTLPPLDLAGLRAQMTRGSQDGAALYPAFAGLGLDYGPALRGIVALHRGDGAVLLELALPEAARGDGYVLHPSLMDSALQGAIALFDEGPARQPWLPFALESLHIVSAASGGHLYAWVRHARGGAGVLPHLTKVDIDLCDAHGNVCVAMRGFSARPAAGAAPFDEARYQSIIAGILNHEISADEAVELEKL
ncbi:SDR family NAD(P)-dependent oxidoreductase [Chitiniphilus purpureus]|uniref:SDR family NAD(P)-dependent oxidoreductase n=1 Tax=Chitiniphilus purpureus TaxID=2981137 RepID=A0ABY6DP36_9NEIS|nr:SDR family NAD(P)-dependent oxidoreductase [Chitiniphilus sp. CD1]UXY16149.1 SDR family NAD(P)-dependent oxidoreductase [Chitiniphilus sp. CD1]